MFRSVSPLGGSRTASPRPGNRTPRSGSLAVVDSRGAQGAGGRSLTPTNFALGPGDIGKYESNKPVAIYDQNILCHNYDYIIGHAMIRFDISSNLSYRN